MTPICPFRKIRMGRLFHLIVGGTPPRTPRPLTEDEKTLIWAHRWGVDLKPRIRTEPPLRSFLARTPDGEPRWTNNQEDDEGETEREVEENFDVARGEGPDEESDDE